MERIPVTLEELIQAAAGAAGTDQPLDQLAAAAHLSAHVNALTDRLLGHFVDRAREAGCSWSQVGAALGVSKQAAQQRFVCKPGQVLPFEQPQGLKRFTDPAKRAVAMAGEEALQLGHSWVGTEHMLLGLFREGESVSATVLATLGVEADAVRARIVGILGPCDEPGRSDLAFTPRAKKVLELALREALKLGHNYVGTEHLLLALSGDGKGVASQALRAEGADHEVLHDEVVRALPGCRRRRAT